MAEGKKSFIAYCDWGEIFEALSNEDAGKLAKHLFDYVRDKNPKSDKNTELLFISIRQSLKRDLNKYKEFVEKQRVNGSKGGRPKKPKKPKPFFENPTKPKKADNDNDNVNDSDNEKENIINNNSFLQNCLASTQWLETTAMRERVSIDVIKVFINSFNDHLIVMEEQKSNVRDYKQHFANWLNKQDLSQHRKKVLGRSNQY